MDGDDPGRGAARRQGVLEVDERRPEACKGSGDGPAHADDLAAGRKEDGLDSGRDELRPARESGEAKAVVKLGELTQEILDVGLVPGALAPEHIRVDDDEGQAHRATKERRGAAPAGTRTRGRARRRVAAITETPRGRPRVWHAPPPAT